MGTYAVDVYDAADYGAPVATLRQGLGLAVRHFRLAQGVSQEGLAHSAGLDRTYVSGLERGTRNPTLESIEAIADALDVRVSRLFQRAETHLSR